MEAKKLRKLLDNIIEENPKADITNVHIHSEGRAVAVYTDGGAYLLGVACDVPAKGK